MAADTTYQHYGERHGLYDKADWKPWMRALPPHWSSFLNGIIERERACRQIAQTLAPLQE